ncbi:MAG: ABC transporter substrate-binding protein, partial [Gemmataceae bacterium]
MDEDNTRLDLTHAGTGTGRRAFIRVVVAGAMAPTVSALLPGAAEAANGRTVSIVSYGGAENDAIQDSFIDPFEKKTGIKVVLGAGASLALLKLQVQSGRPAQWDIVELTGTEYELAVREKLLIPLDYSVMDVANVRAIDRPPYGINYALFTFVMAWNTSKISDPPKTWAEFWDTKRYPGKRSLYSNIADGCMLEAALLADGVAMNDLYPLDVERALKSLDRLGRQNIIWHAHNGEPVPQLVSHEVNLATSWTGRVTQAARQGAHVAYTLDQGGVTDNYLSVSKTSKHAREAFEFLSFISSNAEGGAKFEEALMAANPDIAALKLLPKAIA